MVCGKIPDSLSKVKNKARRQWCFLCLQLFYFIFLFKYVGYSIHEISEQTYWLFWNLSCNLHILKLVMRISERGHAGVQVYISCLLNKSLNVNVLGASYFQKMVIAFSSLSNTLTEIIRLTPTTAPCRRCWKCIGGSVLVLILQLRKLKQKEIK